jgi:ribA/ribD-fused uncharacterized protein
MSDYLNNWELPKIQQFQGKYRFLSNFYPSPITIDEINFYSVEQYYVYNKTLDPELRKKVLEIHDSGKVKKFGREIKLREDWHDIKISVMEKGIREKFSQNEDLKKKLLDTMGFELEECNKWGDSFWGISYNSKKGRKLGGFNILGKLLMKIREELSNQ